MEHARRINQEAPSRKISTASKPWQGPETYTLEREKDGYGFTLRYFIVHPPVASSPSPSPSSKNEKGFNRNSYWTDQGLTGDDDAFSSQTQPPPLDTFFIKTVTPGSTADRAGLRSGDRIVSINGELIGGKTFKDIIEIIQYCTGDLKVGVVPRNEDILQLVFEEYVYDSASVTSENSRNSRNSGSLSMHQPSVNKWSVPITSTRKSVTLDSPNAYSNNNNNEDTPEKKIGPCVQFIAGTPVVKTDNKNSRSNSLSSSGSITPLQKSEKGSPSQRTSSSSFDPCVSFISGKPQVSNESPKEENDDLSSGVQPYKLQNALKKEVQKKGYSVGTRLAPKPIAGVSKPGAVSNIAGLFASGNVEELQSSMNRKKSATFVLRDDFQIRSCKNKVQGDEPSTKSNSNVDKRKTTTTTASMSTTTTTTTTTTTNTNTEKENAKQSPRQRTNLSSSTSQATLVESQTSCYMNKGVSALISNTIVINGGKDGITNIRNIKNNKNSPMSQRKRTLLSNGRKTSISSSLENSEDEDSHVDSGDESALENWNGRRVSYLMATAKKAEKAGKKNAESNTEADDEDSDVNTNSKDKLFGQRSAEETEVKPILKEGPLNRKLERSLDRKKASTRTWKPIYAVLKGHRLFCYKEGSSDADDDIIQPIPVRSTIIEIANDYVKRKHVFRMVTSHGNEYLFQAEDTGSMVSWVNTLRDANPDKESLMKSTAMIKQEKLEESESNNNNSTTSNKNGISKDKKGLSIKRSHFGLRGSKKSRSPNVPPRIPKEVVAGKTFGIHLQHCPPARHLKNIPLLLEHCCSTIEDIGKDLVGIYRVSGNVASVQLLKTELDTKETGEIDWDDDKWRDPNNVGSLLKSFLRNIADPIVPNDLYMKMIQANRVSDPTERLYAMKNVVKSLPEYHFESLTFLVKHLKTMSDNKEKNKMGPENMAIVFGPNIIRTNTVTAMVQDMSDQCKIVETFIKQCDWMFSFDEDCGRPIQMEIQSDVISVGVSRQLMDCLTQQVNTTEQDNETSSKKGKKFSTLKSNISMKLRSTGTKVVSPRSQKKSSKTNQPDDDIETDEESGCYSQSPPTINKNDKTKSGKYRSKEIRHINTNTNSIPIRRGSDNGVTTTKIGNVLLNSEVHMQFTTGLRSPELSPQLERTKPYGNDDGNDSGVTSPQRMDSDDNMSVYSDSGAQSSRKASLESASAPSPRVERRIAYPRQQSIGSCSSNDERSPPLQKSIVVVPPCKTVKEEKEMGFRRRDTTKGGRRHRAKNDTQNVSDNVDDNSTVLKRSDMRRRMNLPVSPRASKRELYSIMPGDGNDYEEKIRALIDPDYEGDMKELAQSEIKTEERAATTKSLSPAINISSAKTPESGPNADWWLSGSKNISRRMLNPPKDKTAALNIITSVIGNNRMKRTSSESKDESTREEEALRRNPLLSPTIVRRTGFPSMATYYPELSTRTDNLNQKQEENDKRVRNILSKARDSSTKSPTETTSQSDKLKKINDLKPTSTLSESQSEKLDRYLKQVTELLSDNSNNAEDREKISGILQSFQTACNTLDSQPRQVNSESHRVRPVANHQVLNRSLSGPTRRTKNNKANDRTSPLLDTTYSDLNYSKLYPR